MLLWLLVRLSSITSVFIYHVVVVVSEIVISEV